MKLDTMRSAPVSKMPPLSVMTGSLNTSGPVLCINCRFASTCMYRAHSGGNTLHCEEFELAEVPPSDHRKPRPASSTVDDSAAGADATVQGLCLNCACRNDCTLGRREGGVWHCEEYR